MDGNTLQKETLMCLTGGLAFLETIPNYLPQNIVQSRNQMKYAFQEVLNKWLRVNSIVPELIEELTPRSKARKSLLKQSSRTSLMKKRSNSVADLYDVETRSESHYVNLTSSISVCNKSASKPTKKRSIYNYISIRTSASKNTKDNVPNVCDTWVKKECDVHPFDVEEFTMRSDGRFSMLLDGVSLQSGNRKSFEKNLYCCLQHHFILFGPKLTNVPPLKVINLENCLLVKSHKKDIHLKDGDEDFTIRYSSEEQAKQWAEKIREISPYTFIPDSDMHSVNEPEKNYSYVRQERFIGNKCSDYEYINSVGCLDCDRSVHKKTSTAEAIIDKSYINLSSSVSMDAMKSKRI